MIAKRLTDLLVSATGLVVLAPLFFVIAIVIRIDSVGPIFFRQKRVGRHGSAFEIIKFRTMHVDAERLGLQITVGKDQRVTKTGRFLRRYKLDELPQLINVTIGDMSLVGPRPEVPKYVDCYPPEIRKIVFSVRPGITDQASIEFRDEANYLSRSADPEQTYVKEVLPIKLGYYTRYVESRSFLGDIRIICKTILAVLS